jgi:hypothetical protein
MSKTRKIICPECDKDFGIKKGKSGRWIGTVVGGGGGAWLFSSLGIAGSILGWPIAIPATFVGLGIGAFVGNRAGKGIDNELKCPHCDKYVSL